MKRAGDEPGGSGSKRPKIGGEDPPEATALDDYRKAAILLELKKTRRQLQAQSQVVAGLELRLAEKDESLVEVNSFCKGSRLRIYDCVSMMLLLAVHPSPTGIPFGLRLLTRTGKQTLEYALE